MIIGGHSHTVLKEPARINNILITQAGVGSDQVGRFDIIVDDDTNSIVKFKWQLIPIDESLAPTDENLEKFINSFKEAVDRKYNTIICKLAKVLTHPAREIETSLGNLIADAFAETSQANVVLVGSGSIRGKEIGPLITLKDFKTCFPYDDFLNRYNVEGSTLKQIFSHIMRKENRNSEGECYQVNSAVRAEDDEAEGQLISLTINGNTVEDNGHYTICLQGYHFSNSATYLNVTNEK